VNYIEYKFQITPKEPGQDVLASELGNMGFESFSYEENTLLAYIPEKSWNANILKELPLIESLGFKYSYTFQKIKPQNWNEQWEKNFHPIVVDNICTVRAPFHKKPTTDFDIVIEPKMSFGTGHHETTYMMIKQLLKLDIRGKKVLDMGCGTGVLAILAEMKGAEAVDAIDIDNWCYLNTLENAERNHCNKIKVFEGDATLLRDKSYDIIIANINRNILLKDIETYVAVLAKNGVLLLSGFYEKDIPLIDECCITNSLKLMEKLEKNFWISLKYVN
jgi:ribosomal protein L11 methyltransferase